jgi:hypothetical protein
MSLYMLNFFPKFFTVWKYVLYIPGAYAPGIRFGFPVLYNKIICDAIFLRKRKVRLPPQPPLRTRRRHRCRGLAGLFFPPELPINSHLSASPLHTNPIQSPSPISQKKNLRPDRSVGSLFLPARYGSSRSLLLLFVLCGRWY